MTSRDRERALRLHLDATLLSRSIAAGQFRSLRQGVHGVDFAGVREYTLNDDARQIDWNVTARSNKAYIKLFEQARDMQIFIVLDRSRSMFTGSGGRTRREAAVEAATLVVLSAAMRAIRVGVLEFDGEVRTLIPPKSGDAQSALILSRINNVTAGIDTANGSSLASAITSTLATLKMRSFVMILSDFRIATALFDCPFAALASRHDAAAICITDSMDNVLPRIGSVRFADAEGQASAMLPTSSATFARDWKKEGQQRLSAFNALCARRGVIGTVLDTRDDALRCLLGLFSCGKSALQTKTGLAR